MLPFGVTIPATVPQRLEIPEGFMNYPVLNFTAIILVMMILLSISPDTFQTMGSWNIQFGKEKKKRGKFKAATDRAEHV